MEGKKSISITPSFFNYDSKKKKATSKSEKKKKDMIVNVNGKSVKEMLLQKLKEYKKNKTKKVKEEMNHMSTPQLSNYSDSFLDRIKKRKQKTENNIHVENNDIFNVEQPSFQTKTHTINTDYRVPSSSPPSSEFIANMPKINIEPAPQYGILKNSQNPTIREIRNRTMKKQFQPKKIVNKNVEIEIERKLSVGVNKTRKKVGVFIKNNQARRNIELEKEERKKHKINDVRRTLKACNLIKYGTYAPNDLLREIYESSQLVGGVQNKNADNMLHNFHSNDEK
jgi:hypothetical protein